MTKFKSIYMKKLLLLFFIFTIAMPAVAQKGDPYLIEFKDFPTSTGDAPRQAAIKLPKKQLVLVQNLKGSNYGLSTKLNLNGNTLIVENYEQKSDGSIEVVLRREDGRNFYGYAPTLKAVLTKPKS